MTTRRAFIERILRQVYGGQPTDDSAITYNLANEWLNDAIAFAAKQNWTENLKMDGIAYLNNSFYTTFSGLAISTDPVYEFSYVVSLPDIPEGLGRNEGIASVRLTDGTIVSDDVLQLSSNQVGYAFKMRPIGNKVLGWSESNKFYFKSTLPLFNYKAIVRMVSGGNAKDLNSVINVPQDYFPLMADYLAKELLASRQQAKTRDNNNNGTEN